MRSILFSATATAALAILSLASPTSPTTITKTVTATSTETACAAPQDDDNNNDDAPTTDPQKCNGQSSYCIKRYSEMTFAASHNSPFVGSGIADNQLSTVTEQLDMGIRFLQAATQDDGAGQVQMCHTSCFLEDSGTLESYLSTVKEWLDSNPDEVLSLLLTNGDGLDINLFGDAFASVGLDQMVFVPEDNRQLGLDEWPTLGDMITSGNRVVVFMDYNMDTSKVPYILDEFAYYFETPFSPTEDNFLGCDVDRPDENLSSSEVAGRMYLMNHNLNLELFGSEDILIPAPSQAGETNSMATIMRHAGICRRQHGGRNPNVVLLDFVNEGQVMLAQEQLNR